MKKKEKKAWTTVARECVDRYNKIEHSVTGFAPEYLLNGTDTSVIPEELKRKRNKDDWTRDRKLALERSIQSHNYNKKLYSKNRKHQEYNAGDMVYIEKRKQIKQEKTRPSENWTIRNNKKNIKVPIPNQN